MDYVTEPAQSIPVLYDVDVVVAGAGPAGFCAAIAAARSGASTVLIDRFGSVGGNIGPAHIVQGHMISSRAHEKVGYECCVYPKLYGIGREFIDRYVSLGGASIPPHSERNYLTDSAIAGQAALKMLEESGVKLLLSTWAANPILNGNRVRGLFVEGKSGREAVRARVVIDATGEADVARRTPAPILYPKTEYHEIDGHAPTGMGLAFFVGGVDWEKYDAHLEQAEVTAEDREWIRQTLGEGHWYWEDRDASGPLFRFFREASKKGEYDIRKSIVLGGREFDLGDVGIGRLRSVPGLARGHIGPERFEELDSGNTEHMSAMEAALRLRIFEAWRFRKKYFPGWENSSLLNIAPYLGSRGGPCIEGEYTLTMDDCRAGRRFDDVMYLYGEFRAMLYLCERGEPRWTDMPYRVMLPRRIDGLLAVGRSASGIPDTLLRNRMAVKVMGEACGTAAALAARKGITPREIDIRELQRLLLDAGFYLGDRKRLEELGLD